MLQKASQTAISAAFYNWHSHKCLSVYVCVYLCELWLMQIAGGLNQIYMIAVGEQQEESW